MKHIPLILLSLRLLGAKTDDALAFRIELAQVGEHGQRTVRFLCALLAHADLLQVGIVAR